MGRAPRSPLQGGLPAPEGSSGELVVIACDESGFSGTNLLDPGTPVITHASVDLRLEEAIALVDALRQDFRWPLTEFKSSQFLRRPQAGAAFEWLSDQLRGRAHVHVVDKELFLVTRVVDLFVAEPSYAAGTSLVAHQRAAAVAVHRAGRAHDPEWAAFLASFVDLVRTKGRRRPDRGAVKRFLHARDLLVDAGLGSEAAEVLGRVSWSRVWSVLTRLAHDDRSIPPPLEPLLPALAETVLHWSSGQRQVMVVHDEQSALTAHRLLRLQQALTVADLSPLAGLVMVDSRDDPRVQVADILAGVARRSAQIDQPGLPEPFPASPNLAQGSADRNGSGRPSRGVR